MTRERRFTVLERDNFACQYCGRRAPDVQLEVDHIRPRSRDGSDTVENLVTACYDCNRGKRDMMIRRKRRVMLPPQVTYDPLTGGLYLAGLPLLVDGFPPLCRQCGDPIIDWIDWPEGKYISLFGNLSCGSCTETRESASGGSVAP